MKHESVISEIETSFDSIREDVDKAMEEIKSGILGMKGHVKSSALVKLIKSSFASLSGKLDYRENILTDCYESIGSIEGGIGNAVIRV